MSNSNSSVVSPASTTTQPTDNSNNEAGTSVSSPTDTSDTGINQDVQAIDSQLQGLGTDSSSANQDVSITSVTQ